MQYAVSTAPRLTAVQSTDPADLESQINGAIVALAEEEQVVIGLTLSGAGDGYMFLVLIQSSLAEDVPGTAPPSDVAVRCYLAGDASELLVARAATVAPEDVDLVDQQCAGAAKGQRFMGMDVYGVPPEAPASLPLSFESHTTGDFTVTGSTPRPFLTQNAGPPLGFTIPPQPAGTVVVLAFAGSMANQGSGDVPQIQLQVNGVDATTPVFGVECGGGNPTAQPAAVYRIALGAGPTVIGFTVFGFNGNTVGCFPTATLPTWVAVTGILAR